MRRGFLFSAARATALASVLWLPCVELVDHHSAQGAPRPDPRDTSAEGSSTGKSQIVRFLEEFWQLAWNRDFNLHQSGMTLDVTGTGTWDLFVHEQLQTVATGQYFEIASLPVPGLGTPPAEGLQDPLLFEHSVTVGLLDGSTGFSSPVYGLRQHIVLIGENNETLVVDGFTPLGMDENLGTVLEEAMDVFVLLTEEETDPDDDHLEVDPCHCYEIYNNEIWACAADAIECEAECAAVALLAIAACLALGPFTVPCIVAVVTGEVVCIAKCLARQRACNLRAENDRLECEEECNE